MEVRDVRHERSWFLEREQRWCVVLEQLKKNFDSSRGQEQLSFTTTTHLHSTVRSILPTYYIITIHQRYTPSFSQDPHKSQNTSCSSFRSDPPREPTVATLRFTTQLKPKTRSEVIRVLRLGLERGAPGREEGGGSTSSTLSGVRRMAEQGHAVDIFSQ
jgi:hypothetical protein